MAAEADRNARPVVLLTGAAGNIGGALVAALEQRYRVVGLDRDAEAARCELIEFDLTSPESVQLALAEVAERHGRRIAAVVHLAAYFDFTGEASPLYQSVNVEGTRNLLRALQDFEVERFIYSGTMLVHRAGAPGLPINEATEIAPRWAYPESKAAAEEAIREEHGEIAYLLLHLAGLYDDETAVPTLVEQIRRIYERDPKAHAYSGSLEAGQSFLHRDDMIEAFRLAVEKRDQLPPDAVVLVGEPEAVGYGELQEIIGRLIHGEEHWRTVQVPKPLAGAAAWLEEKSEPVVPDDFDQGEKPFVRAFMVEMADDHYELDISRARSLLGWEPRHSIRDTMPEMIARLKADPAGWYAKNGLTMPAWLEEAEARTGGPEALRARAEAEYRAAHARFLWAHFLVIGLGAWLVSSPPILAYGSAALAWSDVIAGILIMAGGLASLSWRLGLVRWLVAGLGVWVMFAPLAFWAPTAAGYLNGTLVGALVFGFAVLARPAPGVGIMAATTGPTVPPGWDYSPSDWFQRLPIIILAVFGLCVSRYLAAYQLGHVDGVWEPFFAGSAEDPKNGTEEIITSTVSEAWPVPDAGLGALTYMLEILIGLAGSARRWRTMPWLVMVFGIMIVPLGVVSITFIVIQPIVLGTWCTLCLITAAAMLIQIPYSIDELIATCQFLARRRRAGRPVLRVFFTGDTDDGEDDRTAEDFERPPGVILREMLGGGVSLPWTLAASMAVGVWLMFTRVTLGSSGTMADADHLVGALALTVAVTATAESARPVRFLNVFLGLGLIVTALVVPATTLQLAGAVLAGVALIALAVPRGAIRHRYGGWSRLLV
jgi:nucleoside-diphosphate-sugar epimerase/uncharacterized membrane protein